MGINTSEGILAGIGIAIGAILVKIWERLFPSKRDTVDTSKTLAETSILSFKEEKETTKFWMEQLNQLEKKYITLQAENAVTSKLLNEQVVLNLQREKDYLKALQDITSLKIKLAAYEP